MSVENKMDIKANELIFVIMEGFEGGRVAIEGNIGLVAFGESTTDLTADVIFKVEQYFQTGFDGLIRLREFKDTLIELK